MKTHRILGLFLAAFLTSYNGFGQVQPNAIGIRGGSGTFGHGAEISYQRGIGSNNRLELDLGWAGHHYHGYDSRYSAIGLTGIYQWVWNITGGFNWFVGPGAQVGTYTHYHRHDEFNGTHSGLVLNVGGQIGVEYDFNQLGAPLQLGLDARPMWQLTHSHTGFGYGGALSLRYTF